MHAAEAATLRQLLDHLDRLLAVPAAPPLARCRLARGGALGRGSPRKVSSAVAKGLKLVRQVERVLADESHNRDARIIHANERIAQRLALADERAAGTHWKRRDAGRRAKQPTHVDVESIPPPGVERRRQAAKKGMTIGHYVGTLVR